MSYTKSEWTIEHTSTCGNHPCNTIGGSPRLIGSVLTPTEVSDIIRSATGESK